MSLLNRILDVISRAVRRTRGTASEQDLSTELRHHIELEAEDLVRQGWDPEAARREAFRRFGGEERTKERVREAREGLLKRSLSDLAQDLRIGWRKLASQPGFAVVTVLTLALGIGANTAIFSMVDTVLLRPLSFPDADRLVTVWEVTPEGNARNVVSRGNFMDWRDQAESFEAIGAYSLSNPAVLQTESNEPIRVRVARWTPGVFGALGTPPASGRTFTRDEGVPGNGAVAVLSHDFWQRGFGGDASAVGRIITLDGNAHRVVGIMPEGFGMPGPNDASAAGDGGTDLWVPLTLGEEDRQNRRSHNYRVLARLDADASVERAQAELDGMAARLAELYPQDMAGWGVNVQPFRDDLVAATRPLLVLLLGVAGVVLLLACANLANLLLVRALARKREVALRGALGAGRGRLLRQFLAEAGLIALLGSVLGITVTMGGLDLFVALAPPDIPLLHETTVDGRVLAFSLGATLLATFLFGLLPALRAADTDLQSTFRSSDDRITGGDHRRLRAALLVAEVALAATLLIGSGLLIRSFITLQRQDYGLDRRNVMAVTVDLPPARYSNGPPEYVTFYESLLESASDLPGVVSAAGSSDLPVGFGSMTFSFAIEGRPVPGPSPRESPQPLRVVTPDYFETLRVPLREGRLFTEADDADGPPVILVNEALARLHWPDESAVGQRISFAGPEGPWMEIVGVVGDTRHYRVDIPPSPALFMPHAQLPQRGWEWMTWLNVLVRTEGDPLTVVPAFRTELRRMDDQLLPGRFARLADLYAESDARRRFALALMGGFAALALVMGVIGVHGVLAFGVSRRTREFGIRIALGADRGAIAASVIWKGVALALLGAGIGVALAFVLSRLLESLVYGVGVRDPATFTMVPLVLVAFAALAAYLPARRAVRVDPMESLRAE